jgi:hypothetical protein
MICMALNPTKEVSLVEVKRDTLVKVLTKMFMESETLFADFLPASFNNTDCDIGMKYN